MTFLLKKIKDVLTESSVLEIIKRLLKYYRKYLYYPSCILTLKLNKQGNYSIEQYFDFAFRKNGGLIHPSQIESEIKSLIDLLVGKKIKNFLEIGTATGGTLFLFSKIAASNAKIVSIDLPGGYFGGGYSFFKIPLYKSFINATQSMKLIRGDSHTSETFNELKNFLDGELLDFIFIDGDHSYEGVKKDYLTYRSLLSSNGIIAFHDIAEGGEMAGDVSRFWNELKNKYKNIEFISDVNQSGCGIGVLFLIK